jgi:hypothetical protein
VRISLAPRDKRRNFRVVPQILFVEPGQLREHLQVAKHLLIETLRRQLRVVVHLPESTQQFGVAGIAIDYVLFVGLKKVAQRKFFVGLGQIFGRLLGDSQERVSSGPRCILFNLAKHGGNQVESLMNGGEIFQDFDHPVVVFERVHPSPGEFELARDQILIERLVHVPDKAEVNVARHFDF